MKYRYILRVMIQFLVLMQSPKQVNHFSPNYILSKVFGDYQVQFPLLLTMELCGQYAVQHLGFWLVKLHISNT